MAAARERGDLAADPRTARLCAVVRECGQHGDACRALCSGEGNDERAAKRGRRPDRGDPGLAEHRRGKLAREGGRESVRNHRRGVAVALMARCDVDTIGTETRCG